MTQHRSDQTPSAARRSGDTRGNRRGASASLAALAVILAAGALPPVAHAASSTGSSAAGTIGGSYAKLQIPKADASLKVVLATPTGRLRTADRTVLRWLFDRPVAALGDIDAQLDPSPFVTITPRVDGRFRWVSTRTLLFEPEVVLPLATSFTVTVNGLKALDGSKLMAPSTTTFETPRPQCSFASSEGVQTADDGFRTLRLTCFPNVRGEVLAANTTLEFRPVKVSMDRYRPTVDELAVMRAKDPSGTQAFEDRLAATAARATITSPVSFVRDERCNVDDPQSGVCTVVSLEKNPPSDARIWTVFGSGIVSDAGPLAALPRKVAGPATLRTPFLVTRGCRKGCDPESLKPLDILGVSPFGRALDKMIRVRNTETNAVSTYVTPADASDDLSSSDVLQMNWVTFEPGGSYEITVSKDTPTLDGTLGYDAVRLVSFGRLATFTQVPGGELVVEPAVSSIRARVRNVTSLDVVSRTVAPADIVRIARSYAGLPKTKPLSLARETPRSVPIGTAVDQTGIQSVRLGGPAKQATAKEGTARKERGVFLVAVRPGAIVPGSRYNGNGTPFVTLGSRRDRDVGGVTGWQVMLVQRTDLGVTLKASRSNVVVAVTSLSTGEAVEGVSVSLFADGKASYWSGKTNTDGVVTAPPHPDRACGSCDLVAIVKAKTDGTDDTAYAQTRWRTWGDDYSYEFDESSASAQELADRKERLALDAKLTPGATLKGSMFTDRGVYRLGDRVHVKGVLRMEELKKLSALPKSVADLPVTVQDGRGARIVKRSVKVSPAGSFDLAFTVPAGASQGVYSVNVPGAYASFLVTSFRRPDFVVDTKAGAQAIRGDDLSATATSRYLFGAPLSDGSVRWDVGIYTSYATPPVKVKGLDPSSFSWDYQCFYDVDDTCAPDSPNELTNASLPETIGAGGVTTATGSLPVETRRHRPLEVTFEAEVSDVSRQAFAARATTIVYPGEFSFGVRRTGSFARAGKVLTAEIVAATPMGAVVGSVKGTAKLVRWDWVSVERVSSNGDRVKEGKWREKEIGSQEFTTTADAASSVKFTPDKPGTYEIRVSGTDTRKNYLESGLIDYVIGAGEVAWEENNDSPTVELVADKDSYAAGETAKILIKSPWTKASGLLTLERNGVVEARRFEVTSSATAIDVPIAAEFTPNVYASITLTKGRTEPMGSTDGDRGRPAVLTGSVNLPVPPTAQKLKVAVSADRKEYLPGAQGTATVKVVGADGKPASGEVTLWAVDEGVLRLTNYQTPDLLTAFYEQRNLDVTTSDSRMRLVRVGSDEFADAEKGDEAPSFSPEPGGGGGDDDTGNGVRTDFRILAAWSASVRVGDDGEATVPLKLPQSLTAYRVIAVATSGADRFGSDDSELRISTPFQVRPALPRFVSIGDRFEAGAVVQNLSGATGPATLTLDLPADSPLTIDGPKSITLPSLGSSPTEVRFTLRATKLGDAALTLRGTFGDGSAPGTKDAAAVSIPVLLTQRFDTVATSGQVKATATGAMSPVETVKVPTGAIPGVGGLSLRVSSSNLAGLQESVESLVDYPYGCLEQRSSRLKVILALSSLEGRYELPGLAPAALKSRVQAELNKLTQYWADDGGLSYWPGGEVSDTFLTAKVLDLLLEARAAKFRTPPGMIAQLRDHLGGQVRDLTTDDGEEGAADITSARATVAAVLARAGRPERGLVTTLANELAADDSVPYTEQVALLDAMLAAGDTGTVPERLFRDLLASVRLDGDEASVEAPEDWYGSWFSYRGSGSIVATADLLSLLTKVDPDHPLIAPMSRWLLNKRTNGTWGDTYSNGAVLRSFTDIARFSEKVKPSIDALVKAGAVALTEKLGPTSLDIVSTQFPLRDLGAASFPLTATAKGQGTLHWSAQLRYALPAETLKARNQGFSIERSYFPYKGVKSIFGKPATTFAAGDLVTVELIVTTPDRRSNVVVDDALPAGFEALDVKLASTAIGSTEGSDDTGSSPSVEFADGVVPAEYAGVDHTEVRDDRVLLFATQLEPGTFRYTYTARATAPGRFVAAPTHAEEMYRASVYGRSAPTVVTVTAPKA